MSAGLYVAVACALSFLAGCLAMAGILARYVVRQDHIEQHVENVRESVLAADWRPADPDCDISLWDTMRLPLIPAQRVELAGAA